MSEAMRGSRLGAVSHELDRGPAAATVLTTYVCDCGLHTTLPFAVEADEIPDTWECACGKHGLRLGAHNKPVNEARKSRSHWDILMERRTIADLEELMSERLALLRGGHKRSA